jgi:hypothetical protein
MTDRARNLVLSMKWGTLYPADYVNRLFKAACTNSKRPVHFVCFTDNSAGLDPNIDARPIPDVGVPMEKHYSGAWPKMTLFGRHYNDLSGRALFIDLDTMILDDIDPFYDVPGGIVMLNTGQNWVDHVTHHAPLPASGVFTMDVGSQVDMYDRFIADQAQAYADFQLEQEFIAAYADDVQLWDTHWVLSFKAHLRQPLIKDWLFEPKTPPKGAKMVAFHGNPRPIELLKNDWDKFPHHGRGPVSWFQEYWDRYS